MQTVIGQRRARAVRLRVVGSHPSGDPADPARRARVSVRARRAIGVSRQILSNHLACLRGCGLVVAVPEGRRSRYELADPRIAHALDDLLGLVLAVDPPAARPRRPKAAADGVRLGMTTDRPATQASWPAGSGSWSPRRSPTTSSRRSIALTEGTRVSSAALIGFGLDSVVEVSSAAAVAWQFAAKDPETREKAALRFIAFSFFGLAAYVSVDAVRSLLGVGEAQPSTIGIALAAASLVVMPVLSWAQRRAGRELGSLSAVADSKQTLLCTYLSAVLLVGLLLNSTLRLVVGRPASPPLASPRSRCAKASTPGAAIPCCYDTRRSMTCPSSRSALFGIFGALGFGWRSWEQRRRTGSTGFHGISGRPGSVEWFAGVGFVLAAGGRRHRARACSCSACVDPARGCCTMPWIQTAGHRDRDDRHCGDRLRAARHG